MKLTVCELTNNWTYDTAEQDALAAHIETEQSDFLLLPEMPFYTWLAGTRNVDGALWAEAVDAHEERIRRLEALNAPVIAGTRPVLRNGEPRNEGFIWTREGGAAGVHEKYYLPDEEGFWEATWYRRGDGIFETATVNGVTFGFLICTEMWFSDKARAYGKAGMDILLCPRATPAASTATWLAGGRAAANVSGAFCLSSNFNGRNTRDMDFGGTGWIMAPEEGDILGSTTGNAPFLTVEVNPEDARAAKATYPRYVKE